MTPLTWTATHILVPRERLPGDISRAPNPRVAAKIDGQWRSTVELMRLSGMTRDTVLYALRTLMDRGQVESAGGNVPRYRRVG